MAPRISVAGAGLVGARHIEEIDASPVAALASVVDPGPAGSELAAKFAVPRFDSLTEMLAGDRPDGVILATPNRMHVDGRPRLRRGRRAGDRREAHRRYRRRCYPVGRGRRVGRRCRC